FAAGNVNRMEDFYGGGFAGYVWSDFDDFQAIYYDTYRTNQDICHSGGNEELGDCYGVNDDNADPNYFFNPENEPFSNWDTESVWYFSGNDFPTLLSFCDPG